MVNKIIKNKTSHLADSFKKKGRESLTIMIIPHGHDKIFSFHLNWLTILFFASILFMAVTLSSYGLYLQNIKKQEMDRLKALHGVNFGATLQLHKSSREIIDFNDELLSNIVQIGEIIGISDDDNDIFPSVSMAEKSADTQLFKEILSNEGFRPGFNYLPTVYTLRTLQIQLIHSSLIFNGLKEKLGYGGIGVYSDMPMGRPLLMNASLHDTSGYGLRPDPVNRTGLEFHNGFDTSGPVGTKVYATGPGEIEKVMYRDSGYGNAVIIRHGFGYYSMYAHLQSAAVRPGMKVQKGSLIGFMGRTGRVTGPHLHYEVWKGYQNRINPLNFICGTELNSRICTKFNSH